MGFLPPEREPDHPCKLPSISPWFRPELPEGTRWQCEGCKQIWVVSGPNTPRHPRLRWVKWSPLSTVGPKPPSGGGGISIRRKS